MSSWRSSGGEPNIAASLLPQMAGVGRIPREDADALRDDFHALEQNPDAVMITPLVLEIIAEKTSTNS